VAPLKRGILGSVSGDIQHVNVHAVPGAALAEARLAAPRALPLTDAR
jgi:hypothetical protein